jgi:hypothetical protein
MKTKYILHADYNEEETVCAFMGKPQRLYIYAYLTLYPQINPFTLTTFILLLLFLKL